MSVKTKKIMKPSEFFDSLDVWRSVSRNTLYFMSDQTRKDLDAAIRDIEVCAAKCQRDATRLCDVVHFKFIYKGALVEGFCLSPKGTLKCGRALRLRCNDVPVPLLENTVQAMMCHAKDNSPAITWMQNMAVPFTQRLLTWMQLAQDVSPPSPPPPIKRSGRHRIIEEEDGWSKII